MSGNIPRLLASDGKHREGGFLLSPSKLFIMVAHYITEGGARRKKEVAY